MESDASENGGEVIKLQRYFSLLSAGNLVLDSLDVECLGFVD